jgi:hypothetical protein
MECSSFFFEGSVVVAATDHESASIAARVPKAHDQFLCAAQVGLGALAMRRALGTGKRQEVRHACTALSGPGCSRSLTAPSSFRSQVERAA